MTGLSYQLYSSRDFGPLPETLRMLGELGYGEVEGYGGLFADPSKLDGLEADLEKNGLVMGSAHVGLVQLENDPQKIVEIARRLNIRSIFVPAIPPEEREKDADGWAALGRRLVEAGKPFRDAGLTFGWHNHAFEFAPLGGTDKPLDLLLGENDLALELDVAWVVKGGEDPMVWIDRHADRITAVHVKDIARAGEAADEDGWADPGHGTMDWPALAARLSTLGLDHWVMEHDKPNDDTRFARRAIETARDIEGIPA